MSEGTSCVGRSHVEIGRPLATILALPDRLGTLKFLRLQLGHGLGTQTQPMLGQFLLDALTAITRCPYMDARFDKTGVTQIALGLQPVQ